ncbi:hypothetical protein Hanom_Chr10g00890431 [Helianthus anomalus]
MYLSTLSTLIDYRGFFFFERQIWITDELLEYYRAINETTRSYPSPLGYNAYTPILKET